MKYKISSTIYYYLESDPNSYTTVCEMKCMNDIDKIIMIRESISRAVAPEIYQQAIAIVQELKYTSKDTTYISYISNIYSTIS